jgi:hypothetical protein
MAVPDKYSVSFVSSTEPSDMPMKKKREGYEARDERDVVFGER